MEIQFNYPALVERNGDGGFGVRLPDFPEVAPRAALADTALAAAAVGLREAVLERLCRNEPVPPPSIPPLPPEGTENGWIVLPALMSAKAALHLALRESGISKVDLARRLNHDEKEVRRLLDPRHPSKMPRIEAALAALGKRLVVTMQ